MNDLNATSSKLVAAVLSTAITVVITASIVFGMAGLPKQASAEQMAASPACTSVQG